MKNKKHIQKSSRINPGLFYTKDTVTIPWNSGYSITRNRLVVPDGEKSNICCTCGTRYSVLNYRENHCRICLDDRQYVKESGQQWTSFNTLVESHT
ncbi:MAG: hypothetical protein HKN76_00510, partial [Saprospiraceae bacterium]|nr:hypothetical protein [Saprospiraceae bacterium]